MLQQIANEVIAFAFLDDLNRFHHLGDHTGQPVFGFGEVERLGLHGEPDLSCLPVDKAFPLLVDRPVLLRPCVVPVHKAHVIVYNGKHSLCWPFIGDEVVSGEVSPVVFQAYLKAVACLVVD